MKKIAIIQARMGSTRFPGKVLETLAGKSILEWVVKAAQSISLIDDIVVATSDQTNDLLIVKWCKAHNVNCFQGSELDVLERFYQAAKQFNADVIVRLTADCPLLNSEIISQVLYLVAANHADYASNIMPPTWPDGLDCEAFTFKALEYAYNNAIRLSDREHVTPFIRNNQKLFKSRNVASPIPGLYNHRWTIDTPLDLEYVEKLLSKAGKNICLYKLLEIINSTEDLVPPKHTRNEGFIKSLRLEKITNKCFNISKQMLERALKVIPLGSQTFSKSYIQYPKNTTPLFLTHGVGSKVYDVDGNEYIDLVSALLPNILGYADPDINDAIQNQLQKGISFSLATELEIELAEKLCSIIPSAEKVRFAKNGTDVTSAAVRVARAYTNREKIIVCGYHGWQDWYIGTTNRKKGVPKAVCDLSIAVPYNDLDRIEDLLKTEEIAGIIMEPCNTQEPKAGYLQGIKDLCEKYGSLLIFDEIITGFRFALGGAQEYFGVTPHLSCFGKAMGNGMPISAIVGRRDIMDEMEKIFFSGTFGGETLSLVAAIATIQKIEKCKVIEHLWNFGSKLAEETQKIILKYRCEPFIKLSGYSPWKILQFDDYKNNSKFAIKTFFMQEMIKQGILILGSHNICYAYQDFDLFKIINSYEEVLAKLAGYIQNAELAKHIESAVIEPIFTVR